MGESRRLDAAYDDASRSRRGTVSRSVSLMARDNNSGGPEIQTQLHPLPTTTITGLRRLTMVSTRQAGKSREPAEEDFNPAGSGDEYEARTPEPTKTRGTKRARTTKTTVKNKGVDKRRKKAKLSMLPGMPIDILYEVRGLSCVAFSLIQNALYIDIFSRPPEGFAPHFLDIENPQ